MRSAARTAPGSERPEQLADPAPRRPAAHAEPQSGPHDPAEMQRPRSSRAPPARSCRRCGRPASGPRAADHRDVAADLRLRAEAHGAADHGGVLVTSPLTSRRPPRPPRRRPPDPRRSPSRRGRRRRPPPRPEPRRRCCRTRSGCRGGIGLGRAGGSDRGRLDRARRHRRGSTGRRRPHPSPRPRPAFRRLRGRLGLRRGLPERPVANRAWRSSGVMAARPAPRRPARRASRGRPPRARLSPLIATEPPAISMARTPRYSWSGRSSTPPAPAAPRRSR